MIIDILNWDITYAELREWISTTGAVVDSVAGYSFQGDSCTKYIFQNEEDYLLFKLTFREESFKEQVSRRSKSI